MQIKCVYIFSFTQGKCAEATPSVNDWMQRRERTNTGRRSKNKEEG